MANSIEERVRTILQENNVIDIPVQQIGMEDDLFDLGMDSINSIKIIVAIEAEFSLEFDDEDLVDDNVRSIKSIITYLERRL